MPKAKGTAGGPARKGAGKGLAGRVPGVVRAIPAGRVATYEGVAERAGRPGAARAVGAVLRGLPEDSGVPWWRVVGAGGRLTIRDPDGQRRLQRALLEAEGVRFDEAGRVAAEAMLLREDPS